MNTSSLLNIVMAAIGDKTARKAKHALRRAMFIFLAFASLFTAFLTAMAAVWFALYERLGPVWACLLASAGFLVAASLLLVLARIGSRKIARTPAPARVATVVEIGAETPSSRTIPVALLMGAVLVGVVAGTWRR